MYRISGLALAFFMAFSASGQIDVMTYNIKYANENDGENSWSKRKDFITTQIKFYQPHIMGVQEALVGQLEHFKKEMEYYAYVGAGREDGEEGGEFSAIFYDTTRFKVREEGTFWLSPTPEKPSKGWDAAFPRICTYARLEDENGQQFWVFNTHFDHRGEQAREQSARLIHEKIQEFNSQRLSVILMGDFNLSPETPGIQFLSEKFNDSRKIADLVFGPEGTFNGYKFKEPVGARIDYIFTSMGTIEVEKYGVLTDSQDLKYPSDHFPVWVRLRI